MNADLLRLEIVSLYDGLEDLAPRLEELAQQSASARHQYAVTEAAELSVELARKLRDVERFVPESEP